MVEGREKGGYLDASTHGESNVIMLELKLPYPISANLYWRTYMPKGHKRPITTLSADAKAYKDHVKRVAAAMGISDVISGRVELDIALFPERPKDWERRAKKDPKGWDDSVRCIDLDNALKVTIDALKGVVYKDDKQVRRIIAQRAEPQCCSGLIVHIREI